MDYIDWTQGITLRELPELLEGLGDTLPDLPAPLNQVYESSIHGKEAELLDALYRRADEIGKMAQEKGVRCMIDAEHSYFQPAIDK